MRGLAIASMVGLLATAATACARLEPPTSPSGTGAGTDISASANPGLAGDLSLCVAETNRYRATVGLPALVQATALEEFATAAAEHDHNVRAAHQWFGLTKGGGVSRSEIETLWWTNQAARDVIKGGLSQMWRQGPGGTHYDILSGTFTETGCGVYVNGLEVTVAQEFR
jgi:uncharacterized protein YkwD